MTGAATADGAAGWRAWCLPALLGVVAAFGYARLNARGDFAGVLADGYIYVLLADAFADGWAHTGDGAGALGRFLLGYYPFPPLFPLVLAATGGGADAPDATWRAQAALLGAGIALLCRWYGRIGLAAPLAAGLTVVVALLPATMLVALDAGAETLYFGWTVAALLLLVDGRRPLLAAWVSGCAPLVRTAGVALLAACVLDTLWRRRPGWPRELAVALAPSGAWWAWRGLQGYESSYLDTSHGLWLGSLGALPARLATNLDALAAACARSFDPSAHGYAFVAAALLGACAVLGGGLRLRRRAPDVVYVLLYLALLLVWPYPHHARRFLWVVLPLLLGYALVGVQDVVRRRSPSLARWVAVALVAAIALSALPSTAQMVREILAGPSAEARAVARMPTRYLTDSLAGAMTNVRLGEPVYALLRTLPEVVPAGACIVSAIPEQTSYYARRASISLVEGGGDLAALHRQLARCPYLLMVAMEAYPPNGVPAMYPYRQLADDFEVLRVERANPADVASAVMAMIVRVDPPSP